MLQRRRGAATVQAWLRTRTIGTASSPAACGRGQPSWWCLAVHFFGWGRCGSASPFWRSRLSGWRRSLSRIVAAGEAIGRTDCHEEVPFLPSRATLAHARRWCTRFGRRLPRRSMGRGRVRLPGALAGFRLEGRVGVVASCAAGGSVGSGYRSASGAAKVSAAPPAMAESVAG